MDDRKQRQLRDLGKTFFFFIFIILFIFSFYADVRVTLHCDVDCLFLYAIWAGRSAGVLSVVVVSRHWIQ